jgi:hypothetical protein
LDIRDHFRPFLVLTFVLHDGENLNAGNPKTGPYSRLIHVEYGIKPFVGALDEVCPWSRALTNADVAELAK